MGPAPALAASLALLAAGAAAAPPDEATELEPLVVVGTRHPGEAWDVAGSVTVLDDAVARAQLALDLRDLVRYTPGVAFDGGGTRFGAAGFRIRGIDGNRVLTLVDGIPVAERFKVGSYADSGRDYAELGLIRQVEILRGPASSLYGSKALGGVVAMETVAPEQLLGDGGWLHTAYAGDRDRFGAAVADAWAGAAGGLMLAATQRRGHELAAEGADALDPQDWARESVLAKSVADTRAGTLRLVADYGRETRDTELRAILGTGRFASTTRLAARDEQDAWRAGATLESAGADGARTAWRAYATRAWLDQYSDEYRELADPPVRQERRFGFSQRHAGLGVDARRPLAWAGRRQVLGYGLEAGAGRLEETRDALQTNLADGSQTSTLLGETFPRRDFPVTDTLELGAYVNGELKAAGGALTVMPGARYDWYRLDSRRDPRFDAGSPSVAVTDLTADAVTPRLGLLQAFTPRLRGFAQYARGFRAPPAYDVNLGIDIVAVNARALPNPGLRPERSDAVELGLRWRGDAAAAELSLFETRYRDFIVSNAFVGTDPDTGTRLYQSRNVERARIRGVELRWRRELAPPGAARWGAEAAGAWLQGEDRDSGEPLPAIDPARLVLGLDRETHATALRLRWTAVAAQDDVDDSAGARFEAPGYAVLDLLGEVRPWPRVALRAGVFNVLDRRYWEWGDVYGRAPDDPLLPLLARAGRHAGVGVQVGFR